MGAKVSVRRKKSRAVHQAPEDHIRTHISSRARYRSPPRESHPYDDVLYSPIRGNTLRHESHPYDGIFNSPLRGNSLRHESHPYDDVLASLAQRSLDKPYDEVYTLRVGNAARCSGYSDYEQQSRDRTTLYHNYYNENMVKAHSRPSHFQMQDYYYSEYVQPNVIAEWRLAVFRNELAKEKLESERKNRRQKVRKYTFSSRFANTSKKQKA